ncbi:GPI anchored serine-threonine rich family protein [Aspergillus homomorphus CBS 101889]|uniref:Yeast cell wall synthesis Kre9/Knh1-like N-terminal domain-containing protein n=1 Tax=Aspergillus homomorphus (strain CBS 101889) TaxID=1450537 RepID=A0A395HMQ7_ASPHC|nr:hypothetical protein BO97DRAFT_408325 [Aspergillus homomorphus CBS 101889]RAL08535.1 hypothetical protein BO97DRAFT_408325 [Aspergillus homomorphus CBS 101889]
MRLSTPAILASITTLASAISITRPGLNATYAAGSTITVNWTSVDTDPSHFSLYLWNFESWPPSYVPLAVDIATAELSHRVEIPCDTAPEWGYQISGINGTNVYIIYTQSEKFTVAEPVHPCTERVPSSSGVLSASRTPAAQPTCAAAPTTTVYVTVSPTGSSSALHHHHHSSYSHHHHDHSASVSSHVLPNATPAVPVVVPVVTSRTKTVKPGIVPKTIGWCSDYSHPVTLKDVPTPTAPVVEVSTGLTTAVVTAAPSAGEEVVVQTVTTTISVAGEECAFA